MWLFIKYFAHHAKACGLRNNTVRRAIRGTPFKVDWQAFLAIN